MLEQIYITGSGAVEISRSIEQEIREGRLGAGAKMPTVRALAERLGVSPATVAAAYKELRGRGMISGRGRSGTFISHAPPVGVRGPAPVPAGTRNLAHGNPDPKLLPQLGPALHELDGSHTLYGAELKLDALMDVARRSLERDGVPTQFMSICSGAMDGIERVLQTHLRPGDRVVIEDPGFTGVIDLVQALGLVAVGCPMDEQGLRPDALDDALRRGADAVIVTPRAQNPTGSAIDAKRSRELRKVLDKYPATLIVEDDHAADVAGVPLATLCRSESAHWAHIRSTSKALSPDLRLAIVSGDAETIGRFEGRQLIGIRWVSHILQRLAAAVWSDPRTGDTLDKAARTYTDRRVALIKALEEHGIHATGRSGMNVWIPVTEESATVQALAEKGWAVTAGERFRLRTGPALRVTISELEVGEASDFAAALADCLGPRHAVASV